MVREELAETLPGAATACPWETGGAQYLGGGLVHQRVRELLELGVLRRCLSLGISIESASSDAAARRSLAAGYFCDVSQSVVRWPFRLDQLPTHTTAARIYSFEFDRFLSHEQVWAGLGRHANLAVMSRGAVGDLLGNCMAVQPVATLTHAMVCASREIWGASSDAADERESKRE